MESGVTHLLVVDCEHTSREANHGFVPWFGAALIDVARGERADAFSSFARAPRYADEWGASCVANFWKTANKDNYARVLAALPTAPAAYDAGSAFLAWVDTLVARYGAKRMQLTFNTSGFDYMHLTSLLPPGERSLLYLFDRNDYWPTFNTSAFYAGVARRGPTRAPWGVGFAGACAALGVDVPKFDVEHDHDPLNDATRIGLEAAYVLRALDRGA